MKPRFLYTFVLAAVIGLALSTETCAQEKSKPFIRNQKFISDPVPLDLEQITQYADRVFTGTSLKREEKLDRNTKLIVVEYTFKITEVIKDPYQTISNKNQITFRQWKPITGDADFIAGKKYVVFLNPNSEIGFTSPVGLWQGQFEVEEQKINGVQTQFVKNRLSNKGLSRNLKTQKKIFIEEDKTLNDYIFRASESGRPIRYKEFVRSVRVLDKKRKKT